MPKSKGKNYAVGYGRPPRSGQFKKGQSGNPKGRRKGSQSVADAVLQALGEKVTINENGVRRSITRREALIKQVANRGASGDLNFIKLVFGMLEQVEERERNRASEIVRNDGITARDRINKKLNEMRERMDLNRRSLPKDTEET